MARLLEIKWICFGAMLVLLFATIVRGTPSRAPFEKVKTAVSAAADTDDMTEGDGLMLRRLYGLDESAYRGAALFYPASNMSAEELLLIQLEDASQQKAVREAIEDRLQAQKTNFDGYGVGQMELLSGSLLEEKGNYMLFAVSENPAAIRAAFLEAL